MIHCPKCNEVLGDDVHKCPFCRHEITEEERRNIAKEKEMANWKATIEAMEEYSRRVRNEVLVWMILIVIGLVGSLIITFCELGYFWLLPLLILIVAVYIICSVKWHFRECPYCEESFYHPGFYYSRAYDVANSLDRDYCPRCGGKLR